MNAKDLNHINKSIQRMSLNEVLVGVFILGICSAATNMLGIPSFNILYFSWIDMVFMAIAVLLTSYLSQISHKLLAFCCYQLGGLALGILSGPMGSMDMGVWGLLMYGYMFIVDAVLWMALVTGNLIAKRLIAHPIKNSHQYPISLIIWISIVYIAIIILAAKELVFIMVILALAIKFYQLFFIEIWTAPVKRAFIFSVTLPLIASLLTTGYGIYLSEQLYSDAQSVANQAVLYRDKTSEYPTLKVLQAKNLNVVGLDENYSNDSLILSLLLGGNYIGHTDNTVFYERYDTNDPYLVYFEPLTVLPCIYEYDFEIMQWYNGCEY